MLLSIFTRPVFINPLAYLVIPELALLHRCIPYDFSSNEYIFLVITTGLIEGKLILAGNEYILHLDLYSNEGNVVLGEFYLDGDSVGNAGDFTLQQANGFVTLIFGEGGGSGNIVYPGLIAAWSAKDKSNDDEDKATLRDLTGNGHDITLNGFLFEEMSGYGGRPVKHLSYFGKDKIEATANLLDMVFHITKIKKYSGNADFMIFSAKADTPFKVKAVGISEKLPLKIWNNDGQAGGVVKYIFNSDGVYEITLPVTTYYQIGIDYQEEQDCDIWIEFLPEYPDALVFDGVDDYGINKDMPVQIDFTLIYYAKPISDTTTSKGIGFSKRSSNYRLDGAFIVGRNNDGEFSVVSYGTETNVYNFNNDINYFSKNNFNGKYIDSGNLSDTSFLYIGSSGKTGSLSNMAFYSAYLFDRSLDEQEIKSFIRKHIDPEYLLPSEIPTPDCYYDFSQGSNDDETRDTIKDLSGNGNDAVAHNFAWSGMSGYGGYGTNLLDWTKGDQNLTYNVTSNKAIITGEDGSFYLTNFRLATSVNAFKFRFKVNLVTSTDKPLYLQTDNIGEASENIHLLDNIQNDVIYEVNIPALDTDKFTRRNISFSNLTGDNTEFTIELIPEYEGALVFDGVDDYISLDAFDSGFKTVFMVCNPFATNKFLYDQRSATDLNSFGILNKPDNICYRRRSNGAITLINGVINTKLIGTDTLNIKHLITIKGSYSEGGIPFIGNAYDSNKTWCPNMALYKFLGFKEALTEEQINAIIKKYNLLDGVDEIEVS